MLISQNFDLLENIVDDQILIFKPKCVILATTNSILTGQQEGNWKD